MIKLLEDNITFLHSLGLENVLLNRTLKALTIKEKVINCPTLNEQIRLKKKIPLREHKGKLWNGRRYMQQTYLTKVSYLEYIKNSYKSIKRIASQIQKQTRHLNVHFIKEMTKIASKYKKKVFNLISNKRNAN